MGNIRVGTVGYSYRDWAGIFYPPGTPMRRQLGVYSQNFDVCELSQFTHQMPDADRIAHLASLVKTDLKFFVRLHNAFTHCADVGLALSIAKHFRKAIEPLQQAGKFAGFVAAFPYAFKNTPDNRDYLEQLAVALSLGDLPLQVDFRHGSWFTEKSFSWLREAGRFGFVCVDEPSLPGLVPPLAVSTSSHVLVRLHGRNAESWWSGNPTTRHDYLYSVTELEDLKQRYSSLLRPGAQVSFLFQNHWQAQSITNALQWKEMVVRAPIAAPSPSLKTLASSIETSDTFLIGEEDDSLRPPTSLPISEVKWRVSQAFNDVQAALDLPARETDI